MKQNAFRIWLICILFAVSACGLFYEHVPANNGLGWDGKNYAQLTITFEKMVEAGQVDSYQYQRILTPAIIYYLCKWFHIPLSVETVPLIYGIYNLVLIIGSALLFFAICTSLRINKNLEIIGFASIFFNYFILKNTPYYPVLTDISAFFMGMLLCYCFIKQYTPGMLITLLLGHFTYPLFLLSSLPLFANIRTNLFTARVNTAVFFKVLAVGLIAIILIVLALMLTVPDLLLIPRYTMPLNRYLLPLSVLLLLVYIWRLITVFGHFPLAPAAQHTRWWLIRIIGALFFVAACSYVISTISIPEDVFTPRVFLMNIFQQSIANPLAPIVSHIIYFGPAILLVVFFYRPFAHTILQTGDSALAYFLIAALLSLGSESRQFVHFYPFVIVMLMISLNDLAISGRQAFLFCALSLVLSKCWFTINVPGIFEQYDFMNFPDQRYFMNHGPFMNNLSYFINLGIAALTGMMLFLLFKTYLRKPQIIAREG